MSCLVLWQAGVILGNLTLNAEAMDALSLDQIVRLSQSGVKLVLPPNYLCFTDTSIFLLMCRELI